MERINDVVAMYFKLGCSYKEILHCLAFGHGYIISMRTLKRRLGKIGLFRRKFCSDIVNVTLFIWEILKTGGESRGYRWIHSECVKSGLVVSQRNVNIILGILDPIGIELRKRRRLRRRRYEAPGPNSVWHVDGFDKLAPYGIYVHGCVDGFSRKVIWMRAYSTNKNPAYVARYFIEACEQMGACPVVVRADMGTENTRLCQVQKFLRRNHNDPRAGDRSFIYGRSTSGTVTVPSLC